MHLCQEKNFLNKIVPVGGIALFVLIFFYEMIFFPKIPLFRDLGPFFYPMRFSLAQSLKAVELPLWEPRMAMGFPLLANFQSGAFYPPNLAYVVFPFATAIKFIFVLHFFIAAIGAYLLLRHWRFLQPLALVGSILFTFGGCTVSLVNLLNHFQTAVWLPWLLLLGEKQTVCKDRSKIFTVAILATLQFLAGSPEIYGMSMALFFMNSLRMKWEERTSYARVFASLLTVNVVVAGLAMVQILPTLELLRETARYRAPSLQWATDWSLHPISLVNLIFLDKEVDVTSFARFQAFFAYPAPLLMSLYMGALFPFGLWSWILTESRKKKAILLAGITFSLLLSTGSHTPLYPLFYDYFPLGFLSRFPEKFFFVTFVLLLYITLHGLAVLLSQLHWPKTGHLLLGPVVLCGIFVGFYVFFRTSRESLLQLIASTKGISPNLPLAEEISSGVLLHLERQIALLAGLAVVFFFWQRRKLESCLAVITG